MKIQTWFKTFALAVAGLILFMLLGCARFSTVQTDERTNEKTGEKTTVTTKAASWTLFDSQSSLARWKATQSEKSQGAEVGGLGQEATGTNIVEGIKFLRDFLKKFP